MKSNRSEFPSSPLPDEFAVALERAAHRLRFVGGRCVYFPTIGSTNDVAAGLAEAGAADGTVVIADEQTQGRGRRGRQWYSPRGSGLYVSIVLTPGCEPGEPLRTMGLVPLMAGVALAEAVEAFCGLRVDLKWPNDLYVSVRKLGGILAEGVGPDKRRPGGDRAGARVVVGYGVNVNASAFPPELRDRATSLESELDRRIDRAPLFVETLAALSERYGDLLNGRYDAILDAWRLRAPASAGSRVHWSTPDGPRSGVTVGIDRFGALLVRVEGAVERIVGGELTWSSYAACD